MKSKNDWDKIRSVFWIFQWKLNLDNIIKTKGAFFRAFTSLIYNLMNIIMNVKEFSYMKFEDEHFFCSNKIFFNS